MYVPGVEQVQLDNYHLSIINIIVIFPYFPEFFQAPAGTPTVYT